MLSREDAVCRISDGVYHVKCCKCERCGKAFCRGDKLAVGADGKLFCQQHAAAAAGALPRQSGRTEGWSYELHQTTEAERGQTQAAVGSSVRKNGGRKKAYHVGAGSPLNLDDPFLDLAAADTADILLTDLSPLQLPSSDNDLRFLSPADIMRHMEGSSEMNKEDPDQLDLIAKSTSHPAQGKPKICNNFHVTRTDWLAAVFEWPAEP